MEAEHLSLSSSQNASNEIECQLSEKSENRGDGSWRPNNIREIPQLRSMNPKVS